MRVRIYQCNPETELGKDLQFHNYDSLRKKHLNPPQEAYTLVFEGELQKSIHSLGDIYIAFQDARCDDFTGHSISTSDIIEVTDSDISEPNEDLYFVDTIGFKSVKWEEDTFVPQFRSEFKTIGELRELIKDVSDDTPVCVLGDRAFFHRCRNYIVLDDSPLDEAYES